MQKVAFHNLGCKVNAYEMELMQQKFRDNGYEIVPFSEKADIYIVNTCTVTNIADRKSRQMLHRAKALNPDAVVVAAGCYVETDCEGAKKDESIDLLVGNKEKADIIDIIRGFYESRSAGDAGRTGNEEPHGTTNCIQQVYEGLEDRTPSVYEDATDGINMEKTHHVVFHGCTGSKDILTTLTEHTRAYIKIQDGCDQYCSYCIIPYSRGHVVSRPEEETIREISALAAAGCKEFVITGINLSSYGLDMPYNIAAKGGSCNNAALTDIVKRIDSIDGVERIRLGSLEPQIITDDFLKEMAGLRAFCPHFHLSLQSGSDSVLKRMNRRYTAEEYIEKVLLIRKYFEHPAITTDVIVGFPGETEEEFNETREFLNRVDFYEAHIFAYSRRKGTPADRMPGQLTRAQKNRRSQILMADSAARARHFREYYIGKPGEILIEEQVMINGEHYLTGFNREYVKYACRNPESAGNGSDESGNPSGSLVTGLTTGFADDEILLLG